MTRVGPRLRSAQDVQCISCEGDTLLMGIAGPWPHVIRSVSGVRPGLPCTPAKKPVPLAPKVQRWLEDAGEFLHPLSGLVQLLERDRCY